MQFCPGVQKRCVNGSGLSIQAEIHFAAASFCNFIEKSKNA